MIRNILLFCIILFFTTSLKAQRYSCTEIEHPRILVRFTQTQIENWRIHNRSHIMYLNYLFKDSYIIGNDNGSVSHIIDPARTDIMNFDHLRKENERIRFPISPNGDYIEIKSKKEVEIEWGSILKQNPDCN